MGNKEMVVVHSCHDIATDAGCGQGRGTGRRETDCGKVGVDLQRDPGTGESTFQALAHGNVRCDDD